MFGLPGADARYGMVTGTGKTQYFLSDCEGYKLPAGLSREVAEEWKRQYDLCNCRDCYDNKCKHRNSTRRFPIDAGGECQCLRLAQALSDYAFRNGDGTVIVLPDDLVRAIVDTR